MNPKYLFYRIKYRYARLLNLKSPVDITLELSSYCNAACVYCYHSNPDNLPFKRGIMELSIAKKILLSAKEAGVDSIKTNWRGESTINPRFPVICAYAKELGFIDRVTNSNFIFSPQKVSIFDALMDQTKVKVSLDTFINSVYKKQRGIDCHNLVIHNVNTFYNYPGRNNKLVIQAVRTSLNKDEDLEHEIKRRWPNAIVSIRDVVEGRTENDITDLKQKNLESHRVPCLQAFNRLIFDYNGNAYPCCPDYRGILCFGNIKKKSVKDLFNCKEAIELRQQLKDGTAFKKEPCKSCSSFESYKGFKPNWNS